MLSVAAQFQEINIHHRASTINEEHGVRYAGLDRSAVGGRKYFTALALSKGVGLRFSGHSPSIIAFAAFECDCRHRSAVPQRFIFGQRTLGMPWPPSSALETRKRIIRTDHVKMIILFLDGVIQFSGWLPR